MVKELTTQELLALKFKAKEEKDFNKQWAMEKPLRYWSNKELQKACELRGFKNCKDLRQHVVNIDNQAFRVNKEEMQKLMVLFEDDRIKVVTWLDYDLDTTLCKFSVTDKATMLMHRNMIDIANDFMPIMQERL